jgi:hypothetical protein
MDLLQLGDMLAGDGVEHRKSIIAAITTQSPVLSRPSVVSAAVTLRALLAKILSRSKPERQLLDEWFERIANSRE